MNEAKMLKPALIGGVLLGILSALPLINYLNCVCCAWVILGSMLAARIYVRESAVPVTLGRGVVLGFWTGAIGSAVIALFSAPLLLLSQRSGGILEQVRQAAEQMPNFTPEAREALDKLASQGNFDAIFYIVGFIVLLVLTCVFSMIGAAIGIAVFEKRKPGGAPPPVYSPPADAPPPPPDAG